MVAKADTFLAVVLAIPSKALLMRLLMRPVRAAVVSAASSGTPREIGGHPAALKERVILTSSVPQLRLCTTNVVVVVVVEAAIHFKSLQRVCTVID